jgi:hypothetical protein
VFIAPLMRSVAADHTGAASNAQRVLPRHAEIHVGLAALATITAAGGLSLEAHTDTGERLLCTVPHAEVVDGPSASP